MAQGQRLAADRRCAQADARVGADKEAARRALLMSTAVLVSPRAPIRHLADFQGQAGRDFASQFEGRGDEAARRHAQAMTIGRSAAGRWRQLERRPVSRSPFRPHAVRERRHLITR